MQRTVRYTDVPLFTLVQDSYDFNDPTQYHINFDTPLTILGDGEFIRNGIFVDTNAVWVQGISSMTLTIDPWRMKSDVAYFYSKSGQPLGKRILYDEYCIYYLLGQVAPYVSGVTSTRHGLTTTYDIGTFRNAPPHTYWSIPDVFETSEFTG